MSKREIEAARVFVSDLRHAKKVKRIVARLAEESPVRIIKALMTLTESDRNCLKWAATMALANLS